jgi:hypothetical protein
MINNGLEKNSDKISTIAKDLTPDQRENLFYKNKKNPGTAFLLNLLPGFGVGSFYQGDKVGGTLACFGDLIGLSFYYAASYNMDNSSNSDLTGVLFYLGFGILSFSRIFELIRPWVYSNDYNRKLEDSLRVAVRFMPYIHLVKVSDINGIAEGEDSVYGALLTAYF